MKKIRIGICGYGNLGRGVEAGIKDNPDMELAAIFSRREIQTALPVVHIDNAEAWKDKIDVMVLCGGSAKDLPKQTPVFAKIFNTVDSFDTHAKIPEYLKTVDASAKQGGNVSIISIGWDPGLFSLMRLYMGAVVPTGQTYTFWGKGVSQGHSDAIRRVDGVINGVQYTIPVQSALEQIRNGETPNLTTRQKHTRECFVAANGNLEQIEKEIKNMPHYFDEYDTTVNFVSEEELKQSHGNLPHGGNVFHIGKIGEHNNILEFSLKLDSNPLFTASVLLAYARAAYRLSQKGETGAKTIFDIAPILLSPYESEKLTEEIL